MPSHLHHCLTTLVRFDIFKYPPAHTGIVLYCIGGFSHGKVKGLRISRPYGVKISRTRAFTAMVNVTHFCQSPLFFFLMPHPRELHSAKSLPPLDQVSLFLNFCFRATAEEPVLGTTTAVVARQRAPTVRVFVAAHGVARWGTRDGRRADAH